MNVDACLSIGSGVISYILDYWRILSLKKRCSDINGWLAFVVDSPKLPGKLQEMSNEKSLLLSIILVV